MLTALTSAGLTCTDPVSTPLTFAGATSAMQCDSGTSSPGDTTVVVFDVPGDATVYANAMANPKTSVAHGYGWAVASTPQYAARVAAALGGQVTKAAWTTAPASAGA